MPLRGTSVLITGAADGIGAATARALTGAGASVVLVDVQGDKLYELELQIGLAAMAVEADVTDATAMAGAVTAGIERFGGIDAVVAGAGIDAIGPAADMEDSTFAHVIEVNLLGTWRTIRAALPELRRRRGYLLIISSGSAVAQGPFEAPNNASKAGVAALANNHATGGTASWCGGGRGVLWPHRHRAWVEQHQSPAHGRGLRPRATAAARADPSPGAGRRRCSRHDARHPAPHPAPRLPCQPAPRGCVSRPDAGSDRQDCSPMISGEATYRSSYTRGNPARALADTVRMALDDGVLRLEVGRVRAAIHLEVL